MHTLKISKSMLKKIKITKQNKQKTQKHETRLTVVDITGRDSPVKRDCCVAPGS